MSATRLQKTLADYLTIAISPVLIMAMVGSLMFFLLEVLYVGQYMGRMKWVLFCFVVAIVLVARISMMAEIAERAGLYGIFLACAAGFAVNRFAEYPPGSSLASVGWMINLVVLGLVWWAAHKLTWDCTLVDDEEDSSGQGLLQSAGLEPGKEAEPDQGEAEQDENPAERQHWFIRMLRSLDRKGKARTPGVWVVYFSLAALPLFGLGQLLAPASDLERRRYLFWLLCIYVTSGLGLMLTTSFLGLRKYLRQKKLQMPVAMTGLWLLIGGGMILTLLILCALIPRPNPEYPLSALTGQLGSKDRDASRYAMQDGDAGQGEGRESSKGRPDEKSSSGQQGKSDRRASQSRSGGNQGSQSGGQNSGNRGGSQSGRQGGSQGSAKGQQNQGSSKQGDQRTGSERGEQRQPSSQGGDGRQQGKNPPDRKDQDQRQANQRPGSGSQPPEREQPSGGRSEENRSEGERSSQGQSGPPESSSSSFKMPEIPTTALSIFKYLFYAAALIVGGYFLIRYWPQFVAWLRDLLNLFRGTGRAEEAEVEEETQEERPPPRPFATFENPFATGRAGQWPPAKVVRHTFEAAEAWAYEQGLARLPKETPIEFVERLVDQLPKLGNPMRQLGDLYARAAYARGALPASCLETLKQVWKKLTPAEVSVG